MHKHKYVATVKFLPDYFGRHGFKRPDKMLDEAKLTREWPDRQDSLDGVGRRARDARRRVPVRRCVGA
jgi:hypothetical protein